MCVVDHYYFTGHLGLGHSRAYGRQHPSRRIPSRPLNFINKYAVSPVKRIYYFFRKGEHGEGTRAIVREDRSLLGCWIFVSMQAITAARYPVVPRSYNSRCSFHMYIIYFCHLIYLRRVKRKYGLVVAVHVRRTRYYYSSFVLPMLCTHEWKIGMNQARRIVFPRRKGQAARTPDPCYSPDRWIPGSSFFGAAEL